MSRPYPILRQRGRTESWRSSWVAGDRFASDVRRRASLDGATGRESACPGPRNHPQCARAAAGSADRPADAGRSQSPGAGRLHPRARRRVRALAVGGRARVAGAALHERRRPAPRDGGCRPTRAARPAGGAALCPSRPRRHGGRRGRDDRGLGGRAILRGARPAHRRGVRALRPTERRVSRPVRLSVHHRRAAPRQGLDTRRVRAAAGSHRRRRSERGARSGARHRTPAPGRIVGGFVSAAPPDDRAPAGRGAPALTTHVLDTASGRPAAGLRVDLAVVEADGRARVIKTLTTNADGRTDGPLLAGNEMKAGRYEITFHVGAYFAATASSVPGSPFLDQVPVRFVIAEPAAHYHVPLLVSPFGYTTYRGS